MAVKDQKFYWLKLKVEFMTGEVIDFLMSQKNGANYVVLYQMLCVKTINTEGELVTKLGDILVPFDVDKIQRECKWFDRDTIIVAMELYKKLGLLYEQENGIIKIANFDGIVGNETYWSKQKRLSSERKKINKSDNVGNELEKIQQSLISNISNSYSNEIKEIIDYLNSKLGTNYKTNTEKTRNLIIARLKEKFTVADFKTVIDKKTAQWKGNSEMECYLRPETLFCAKHFESYLNEIANIPKENTNKRKSGNNDFMTHQYTEEDYKRVLVNFDDYEDK